MSARTECKGEDGGGLLVGCFFLLLERPCAACLADVGDAGGCGGREGAESSVRGLICQSLVVGEVVRGVDEAGLHTSEIPEGLEEVLLLAGPCEFAKGSGRGLAGLEGEGLVAGEGDRLLDLVELLARKEVKTRLG